MRNGKHEPATKTPAGTNSAPSARDVQGDITTSTASKASKAKGSPSRFRRKQKARRRLLRKLLALAKKIAPRLAFLKARPWGDPADFVPAVLEWAGWMAGGEGEASFLALCYEDGQLTHARGPVFSRTPDANAKRRWALKTGALLSEARIMPMDREDLRVSFSRTILRALALAKATGPTGVATGCLARIVGKAVASLPQPMPTESAASSGISGRLCEYPGCGKPIIGRRSNAKYCLEHDNPTLRKRSRTAKKKAQRTAERQAEAADGSRTKPGEAAPSALPKPVDGGDADSHEDTLSSPRANDQGEGGDAEPGSKPDALQEEVAKQEKEGIRHGGADDDENDADGDDDEEADDTDDDHDDDDHDDDQDGDVDEGADEGDGDAEDVDGGSEGEDHGWNADAEGDDDPDDDDPPPTRPRKKAGKSTPPKRRPPKRGPVRRKKRRKPV